MKKSVEAFPLMKVYSFNILDFWELIINQGTLVILVSAK